MTEQEWERSTDPQAMLVFVQGAGLASERQLRLFACACCRRIWPVLPDESLREAVRATERHIDGLASHAELRAWAEAATEPVDLHLGWNATPRTHATRAAYFTARRRDILMASTVAEDAVQAQLGQEAAEQAAQADILRDLFGPLPFRPIPLDAAVLAWNGGTVVRLAQAVYEERAFARLPILADALEGSGVDNPDILNHCRRRGGHVHGCWLIDLLLGRQ
jgi:hypothetical protein